MLRLDKLLKPWKESAELCDHINLYGFWSDTAFLTKSGDLGMVLKVSGVDYESLDYDEQEYAVKRLEAALKNFGPGFRVYQYLFKTNHPDIPFADYDHPIVQAGVERRRDLFYAKAEQLFQIEIYYCVLIEGSRSKSGLSAAIRQMFGDPAGAVNEFKSQFTNRGIKQLVGSQIERDLSRLEQRVKAFANQLADFVRIEILGDKQQFHFFRRLVNYDDWRIEGAPKHSQFLDFQIANSTLEAERDHLRVTYCVRDAIAVSHEATLAAVIGELMPAAESGESGMDGAEVVQELMARAEEHNAPMRSLKLLGADESVFDFSFRQFYKRVETRLGRGLKQELGIARWASPLAEPDLYNAALRAGAGALSLAVLSWIVAAIRVGEAVREDISGVGNLSYQGRRRLGLREVILPETDRLLRDDPPFGSVAAAFAHQVVQQHLQIAWSRLQVDPQRDVALLTAEGRRWYPRGKAFGGGRTLSRLQQAIGWMQQLRLIDSDGTTSDGDIVLARALKLLSGGPAA